MTDRIYVGNAKKITTQFGELTKISFREEDIENLKKNTKDGWCNVVVKERREPSKTGFTHYLEVDTFKPDKEATAKDLEFEKEGDTDLPF